MTYLGIDGGGSKTSFLLVDDQDREICRSQSGPSNYLSVGKDAAARSILDGLSALKSRPDVVCGGFAGAGRSEGLEFYRRVVEQALPGSRVRIESDAIVAYAGAIGLEPGVLLIAGTGSIAIGRLSDGTMIRVGGWGPHFGDEGGGFWIGREAVRTALRAVDSRTHNEFADRIAAQLGMDSIPDVVSRWATGTIGVPEIAALFPVIIDMWPTEPAASILRSAASQLRSLTEAAVGRVDVANCRMSCSGSVANNSVMRQLIGVGFQDPKASPEYGAIALARSFL